MSRLPLSVPLDKLALMRRNSGSGIQGHLLKAADCDPMQPRDVGSETKQLVAADFAATQLRAVGFHASQLKAAGFNATHSEELELIVRTESR